VQDVGEFAQDRNWLRSQCKVFDNSITKLRSIQTNLRTNCIYFLPIQPKNLLKSVKTFVMWPWSYKEVKIRPCCGNELLMVDNEERGCNY